jgi:hypothetical protein
MPEEVDPNNAGAHNESDSPSLARTQGKWQEEEGQETCNMNEGICIENIWK